MSHGSHSHGGMDEHTTMATNASTAMMNQSTMEHPSGNAHLGGHGEAAGHAVRVVNCKHLLVLMVQINLLYASLVGNWWHLRYL